jgi:hypothetical protein
VSSVLRRAALFAGAVCASMVAAMATAPLAQAAAVISSEAAPTLTGPADSATAALKDVVLTWTNNAAQATKFQVQVSPNGDWTNNTVTLPNSGVTVNDLYEMPLSLPHANYYWRVRALDNNGNHTSWSAVRTFLREWRVPLTILRAPAADDTDVSLAWAPVAKASLYRVRLSTEPDFSGSETYVCWTQATTFTPYTVDVSEALKGDCFSESDLTDGTQYYWEVVAYDDSVAPVLSADTAPNPAWECAQAQPECDSAIAGSSDVFTFHSLRADVHSATTVSGLATTWHAATLPGTDCTGGTCPVTPTFSWAPVSGANYYRVHIWRVDPAIYGDNTYRVYKTAQTTFTPRDSFFDAQAGTPYWWTVEAGWCRNSSTDPQCSKPAAGSLPTSPSCHESNSQAPSPPSIDTDGLTPTSMTAGDAQTITLNGSGFAAGACVKSSGGGLISNINDVSGTQITFDYVAPDSPTSVTFNVVNPDGGTSNASPNLTVTGQFKKVVWWAASTAAATFEKQSGTVTLNQPADGSSINNRSVTFSWNDFEATGGANAFDARNYRLQVSRDGNFDTVNWDTDAVDLTRFTNPDALLPDGTWYWRVAPVDESNLLLAWSATHSFTKDTMAPVFSFTDTKRVPTRGPLHVSVNDSSLKGVVSQSTLHVLPVVGGGSAVGGSWIKTSTTTWRFTPNAPLVPGQSYRLAVVGGLADSAGNAAVASNTVDRATGHVDDKDAAWHFSSGWKRISSSSASGGTFSRGVGGSTATVRVVGSTVVVYGCKAPHLGHMRVSIDGVTKVSPSMAQSFTSCGVVVWKGSISSTGVHTLKVTAVKGSVDLDRAVVS